MSPTTTRATTWQLITRAVRLRCPHCGGGGIFKSFFALKPNCPTCGLRLERGEGDYFVGAYLFNLIAVELILAFCVGTFVIATWPNPPWDVITYVTGFLMLAGCVLCYPFSKTTWLAVDLAIRPMSAEELLWHREGGDIGDRELPHV
ncbi:MAG TPA: DUF983 domain-containing protein [Gemmatimonas aurantiaca]|uniref:DUF983 domain-containing protein n=2 Tax=Gemmatimonas aurantiaca TaxID=173480 RepID=A0A3D4VB08_9BACT|nr:DUF983 domain-containing protein [Gemmatimonas aurantiaca]BAH39690.1 hypothetical membrane protein [Gemmatimonas aurantiaca T-27]HCT58300.1 DUF983 domain-containing protein [Gemmatimonas aurantiaca]